MATEKTTLTETESQRLALAQHSREGAAAWCRRWAHVIDPTPADAWVPAAYAVVHAGEWWAVTTGTEDGVFAYPLSDLAAWVAEAEVAIAERGRLCDHAADEEDEYGGCDGSCIPLQRWCDDGSHPSTDPDLAVRVYADLGEIICEPGTCAPLLLDDGTVGAAD